MESLTRSLNYELPQELHFDQYAQHILQNGRDDHPANNNNNIAAAFASTPTITSLDAVTHHTTTSEFLKKLGASFIHSIQLQTFGNSQPEQIGAGASIPYSASIPSISTSTSTTNMDLDFTSNNLMLDSQNFNTALDELQKQLEYDKFMNEVWIGVVLTLVFISLIFCFCSCFLYHQFRMWKRNYRSTVTSQSDAEACKINLDLDDPVPEYTLVSGLPSYDAALELLHKNPQSCLIVHPSVFEVFNKNEKTNSPARTNTEELTGTQTQATEASQPLLSSNASTSHHSKMSSYIVATLPTYNEAITSTTTAATTPTTPSLLHSASLASILTMTSQKSQLKNKSTPTTPTSEKPTKS